MNYAFGMIQEKNIGNIAASIFMFVYLLDRNDEKKIDLYVIENKPTIETLETTKGKLLH